MVDKIAEQPRCRMCSQMKDREFWRSTDVDAGVLKIEFCAEAGGETVGLT